jgi:hypothetical protein
MRLFDFFPIDDLVIDGESLIERIFGPDFCAVDEVGYLVTTKHNHFLLQRVKGLLDQRGKATWETLADESKSWGAQPEIVNQRDYELAVSREVLYNNANYSEDSSLHGVRAFP